MLVKENTMADNMERHLIGSSQIENVGYSSEEERLEIEFKNGSVYSYEGVSQNTFEFFLAAPSKGKFFHAYIRDKYPTMLIRK